jgi:AcrR family transcriptional regulator
MADIAQAAGLSRPALYQHFANKDDIFRHLTRNFLAGRVAAVRAVLADAGAPAAVTLKAAFAAKDGPFMAMVLDTPHGRELMEGVKDPDLIDLAQTMEQFAALLADWLSRRGVPHELGPPQDMARDILAAVSGLKQGAVTLAAYEQGRDRLAVMFARALG